MPVETTPALHERIITDVQRLLGPGADGEPYSAAEIATVMGALPPGHRSARLVAYWIARRENWDDPERWLR